MAERRMIASNIFEDEWFGTVLDSWAQVLWIGLITTIADDQGRFLFNEALIRSKLFPYRDQNLETIADWVCAFGMAEKIFIYKIEDKQYCQIIHWWKYQQPSWATPSKYPAPEGWTDRIRYHVSNREIKEANWNTPGGFLPSPLSIPLPSDVGSGIEKRRVREGGEKDAKIAAFAKFQNEIGMLTPTTSDMVGGWIDDYSDDWVCDAIDEAVRNNVRKPAYIDKILQTWKINGRNGVKPSKHIPTLEEQGYKRVGE